MKSNSSQTSQTFSQSTQTAQTYQATQTAQAAQTAQNFQAAQMFQSSQTSSLPMQATVTQTSQSTEKQTEAKKLKRPKHPTAFTNNLESNSLVFAGRRCNSKLRDLPDTIVNALIALICNQNPGHVNAQIKHNWDIEGEGPLVYWFKE